MGVAKPLRHGGFFHDTGYSHDGPADKDSYPHDCHADNKYMRVIDDPSTHIESCMVGLKEVASHQKFCPRTRFYWGPVAKIKNTLSASLIISVHE